MTINLKKPDITELKPRITVFGVGGGGGNAVNNMITCGLDGVDFVVANTDAQALTMNKADRIIQLGMGVTEGLGAGSQPEIGRQAAEECIDEIDDHLNGTHMCFVTAGMGGGTGTGAAPVVARAAREKGILTVGVVTKPFHFEGQRRMSTADDGITSLQACVDTLIVIPNQNLFRIANDKTTFADAFGMADQVLYSGVACITDLMVKEGLINLDFADVRSVMRDMGKAMMGTGEASGEGRAMTAAEAAIANPLLDETSMKGAKGLLISITGGRDMTLFEVDEAATRIREEVDQDANIILGATFDESLEGLIRVSVVATGIDAAVTGSIVGKDSRTTIARAVTGAAASTPSLTATPRPAAATLAPAPAAVLDARPQTSPLSAPTPAPAAAESSLASESLSKALEEDMSKFENLAAASSSKDEFKPQSKLFSDVSEQPATKSEPAPAPAAPTTPTLSEEDIARQAAARMPRVEDFPPMVQAAVETSSQPAPEAPQEDERGPLGLLKRLANGLSAKADEESTTSSASAEDAAPTVNVVDPSASTDRRPLSQDAAMYAPRSGQLDDHGRTQPRKVSEDEQLEIPAFLRRQAN